MRHRLDWARWLFAGVMVLSGFPGVARAESEVDVLLKKLVEKGILSDVDAKQIRQEIIETKDVRNAQLAKEIVPESARNWKWGGDIRLREEYRNQTGDGKDLNRQRIRFRYGFEAKANDQLTVGARFATANTSTAGNPNLNSPISANQSFDTSFNHLAFWLDRAYVNYTPDVPGITKFKLSGGVIENPYWHREQLVWDDDLNFAGANVHAEEQLGPVNLFTNLGAYSLNTNIVRSSALWAVQGGTVIQPFKDSGSGELVDNLKLTGALAYYDYMNVTGKASDTTALANAGGLSGSSSSLKDWNLLNPNFAIDSQLMGVPFGFYGDWVHNTAAFEKGNGVLVGLKVGNAQVPFDLKKGWEAGYYFEHLEPNGTFGALSFSDFGNGGTNHRGSAYWVKLAVLKNSTVGLTALNTQELSGSKNHVDTYQMDWVTKF